MEETPSSKRVIITSILDIDPLSKIKIWLHQNLKFEAVLRKPESGSQIAHSADYVIVWLGLNTGSKECQYLEMVNMARVIPDIGCKNYFWYISTWVHDVAGVSCFQKTRRLQWKTLLRKHWMSILSFARKWAKCELSSLLTARYFSTQVSAQEGPPL